MIHSFWDPVLLSIRVALLATAIVIVCGTAIGWWMARYSFPGKVIVETILMLPLVLPPTVVGLGLLMLFGKRGWIGEWLDQTLNISLLFTYWGAVLAAAVVSFPLVYQTIKTGFTSIDKNLELVARSDGANGWKVFWHISLPLTWRHICTAIVFGFTRGLGEFGATLMFAGNIPGKTQTIPTAIYVAVESGQMAIAGTWALSMVVLSFAMLLVVYRLQNNTE